MQRLARRAPILGTLALALTVGGCVLITGGTGGYSQSGDGGGSGLFGDAGSSCAAAADCDGGQICCLSFDPVALSITGSCEPAPTCGSGFQLCTTNAECGPSAGRDAGGADAGACVRQQCEFGGTPATFSLCGQVLTPYCAPAP